ncbi:recombinase family protein [Spongiactinospora sp. 9N601]|uniref:recombinase family protein n=1 Tax=Spongiactinospora sp. 9N601 TaxID=3375149 RepID=UPI0037A2B633
MTAPRVRWVFARRLSGVSMAGIARELNERGMACPSCAGRVRNAHRSGAGWTLPA